MKTVIWLQPTHLNAQHEIFHQVKNFDAVLFIWDEKLFDQAYFSKQRRFFIWQCLQEFKRKKLIVIKGNTHQVLNNLYAQNEGLKVFTPEFPSLFVNRWQFVEMLKPGQLMVYENRAASGFFKFWNSVEKSFHSDLANQRVLI